MSPRQRLEKLLNRQLFQELAPHRQEVLRRTVVLDAELCSDGCGIAETDLHKLAACALHDRLYIHLQSKCNFLGGKYFMPPVAPGQRELITGGSALQCHARHLTSAHSLVLLLSTSLLRI